MRDEKAEVFISKDDSCGLAVGDVVRLMGLCEVEVSSIGDGLACKKSDKKPKDKIQWVQEGIPCKIIKPDGISEGLC